MCPYKYKYELVDFFVNYKGWNYNQANKLSKKQLYAIYYKTGETGIILKGRYIDEKN